MSNFTTQSQVEALMAHGPLTTTGQPSVSQVTAQMDLDADRIRAVLEAAGFSGDPTLGTALYGLCSGANALLSASWGIGMFPNLKESDLALAKSYREAVERDGGVLGQVAELAQQEALGGLSAVSVPELTIEELIHMSDRLS